MRKVLFAVAATALLAACVAAPKINSTFDPNEVSFIKQDGKGSIKGQAFMRRNDGVVVYGAGSDVYLIPKGKYSEERINALYRGGKFNAYTPNPATTDPRYTDYTRTTKANGEGRFEFQGIADGEYYIAVQVMWMAGDMRQGGSLMERASIKGGNSVEVIMTGQ